MLKRIKEHMIDSEFTGKVNSLSKVRAVQEFTAATNQTIYTLNGEYEVGKNLVEVVVGGVPQLSGRGYLESSSTTITLTEAPPVGTKVKVTRYEAFVPASENHKSIHYAGGQDELDVTQLKNYNVITDQLAQIVTVNIQSKGAKGDGVTVDDAALDSAITFMQGKKGIIHLPATSSYYKFTKDFSIPDGVSLVSNGATIHNTGKITLLGNNKVSGITFDGKWSTKGLHAQGANCTIHNNTFLNTKQSSNTFTSCINVQDTNNAHIHHNRFDGIKPYDETLTNQNGSVSRAVRICDSFNVVVENNFFDNMEGYADSDYIHVVGLNSVILDNRFPFNAGGVNGKYSIKDGIIIRNNVIYHAKCKSDIKIQDSGVIVEGNTIYFDERFNAQTFHMGIRIYNSEHTLVKGNQLISDSQYAIDFISVEFSENVTLEKNKITSRVESLSTLTNKEYIYLSYVNKIKVIENSIDVFGDATAFYLNGTQKTKFIRNSLYINESTANSVVLFHFKESTDLIATDGILVANTEVNGQSGLIQLLSKNTGVVKNIKFLNNVTNDVQTTFDWTHIEGLTISNNLFKIKTAYFMQFLTGTGLFDKVKITNNVFDNSDWTTGNLVIIRSYKPVTNLLYSRNDLLKLPSDPTTYDFMYNTSGTQDNTQVTYIAGNSPSKLDVGYTSGRNPYAKPHNFMYYDMTLNKHIWWNGTVWKDGVGATV